MNAQPMSHFTTCRRVDYIYVATLSPLRRMNITNITNNAIASCSPDITAEYYNSETELTVILAHFDFNITEIFVMYGHIPMWQNSPDASPEQPLPSVPTMLICSYPRVRIIYPFCFDHT